MVGRSSAMLEVYDLIERVGPTDATVLITGETGTGKEIAAETLHGLSARRSAPLLPLNCSAISSGLFESELFGHERGSFTGADRRRIGHFEHASGGTLLLDEVTEMPPELQAKLLRVLENGTLLRVGSSQPVALSVRILATTNRDPLEAVESGRLREDLYHRLNVFPIELPPLRDRGDDVALLARHFLAELNQRAGSARCWSEGALEQLQERSWPGNVRELRSAVQRAFILCDSELRIEALGKPEPTPLRRAGAPTADGHVGKSLAAVERDLIVATLEQLRGNKRKTAELLGISRKTLYNRLNGYQMRDILLRPSAQPARNAD